MIKKFKASIIQFGDDALLVRVKSEELKVKLSEYILSLSEFLMRSEECWIDVVSAEESLQLSSTLLKFLLPVPTKSLKKKSTHSIFKNLIKVTH